MMENNKGSMIVLTVIGIATLLIAVIGATFAYFTVTLKYVDKPTETVIESATMVIEYQTLNSLVYEGAIPGRPSQSEDPAAQNVDNKLSFSLTSAQNMTVNTKYEVYLVIEDNSFESDNLVYMMNQTSRVVSSESEQNKNENNNDTTGEKGIEIIDSTKKTTDIIIENGSSITRDVGIISKDLKKGDKLLIGKGNLGSHRTVDTWEFEVWLKEIGGEQNYDQGKVLKAHIEVEPIEQTPVTYEPDKVTNN